MALINQTVEPPCFGKSWDQKSALCMGGIDTTYTNAHGEHVRETCRFMPSCSIRCQAHQQAQQPTGRPLPVLPASSSPAAYQPPPWRPQQSLGYPGPSYPQQHTSYAQVQQIQQPTPYSLPQFLPVRESLEVPRAKRFLVEVLRGIGMAFGHTIANFFAHESFSSNNKKPQQ